MKFELDIEQKRIQRMLLDQHQEKERIPAAVVYTDMKKRHGKHYQTPGYYLRLYRLRAELTQVELADKLGMRQHHLSEMEHNKRPIGKAAAQKLARVLKCDYHRFL